MKGIIIHGNPMWGDNERATYCEFINEAAFELKQNDSRMIISSLEGEASKSSKAVCSKDDIYDFETGALIALMKMCGVDKVVRACNEAFSEDTFKTYATKYERELNELKKEVKRLTNVSEGFYEFNGRLIDEIDQKNYEIISLKALKISNEALKKDCVKYAKENMELKHSNETLKKDNELFRKICEKLKEENECLKNENALLRNKNNELTEKKKDLKKKLNAMYGYIDTDNTKPELPRTLDINGTVYRKSIQIKDFGVQIKPLRPLTKREQMWDDIKTFTWKGASCVEVDRADVISFLEEIEKEVPLVRCPTGTKPTSMKPMFNFKTWHECNKIYFFIDDDYITYGFDKESSRTNVQYVTYFPPMRWDLFKKGRFAVKVTPYNYKEFYEACEKELGKKPSGFPILGDDVTISICKKDGNFEIFTIEDQKKSGKKIVDWEDAR